MKMIWAIIRPEYSQRVIDALEKTGISAMTRMNVTGHGAETELMAGLVNYSEIPKEMLMIVLPDIDVARAVRIISTVAKTWQKENPGHGAVGDGKIFVTYVDDAHTIRTAENKKRSPGLPATTGPPV
ncbi:nitrogen regulatory protein P-II [Methanoregula boonei 6A8]|jgi:nitrogen regulatory protein PII 1|uniref:Nitrogen regulatory protein P-II n=1 Tax=Methanoregula boonei (strain DSM 21154 / JCM 14090 / 6A8) TaxID=456442 RepID=A7I5E5_METB6|nr:P-II family nitrogen regulator [Methanoregula boonei]ABS54956.1 nitrogen regulatory protein P-II [Methanoregula boonei 6A8]